MSFKMNYTQKDYMIKIGEYNGNIIEVPDIFIFMVFSLMVVFIYTLASKNK